MTPPHLLDPPALHAFALSLAHRTPHWSELAVILGRVQDEKLYATEEFQDRRAEPFGSARAWAHEVLDLPPRRFVVLVERLWPMLQSCLMLMAPEAWQGLPYTRAILLVKALRLGGDPRTWIERALTSPSTLAFRMILAGQLPPEQWRTRRFRVPVNGAGVDEILDEAERLALPRVLGHEHTDPERIHDPDVEFRVIERLAAHYISTHHLDVDDEEESHEAHVAPTEPQAHAALADAPLVGADGRGRASADS